MYLLRFKPIFRRYLWGGHLLRTRLNKPIGDATCAESWEIVDHGNDQSIVASGPLAGRTLAELVQLYGRELLGDDNFHRINDRALPTALQGRFPLLLKFLDANRNLSVQVHPDDAMAATLDPQDLGKTESWYVMHAEPGSRIYAGLKPGVGESQFRQAIAAGTTDRLLHSFEPAVGDCISIQAGTLHAIGAGLLIAEIQQASDTTFRIFDWNRVDDEGKPRDLHIEPGLAATDFDRGPVDPIAVAEFGTDNAQLLVANEYFEIRKWIGTRPVAFSDNQLHILVVVAGRVSVSGPKNREELTIGDSILIPAACRDVKCTASAEAEILDIALPRGGEHPLRGRTSSVRIPHKENDLS